jgi:hypothetical protein
MYMSECIMHTRGTCIINAILILAKNQHGRRSNQCLQCRVDGTSMHLKGNSWNSASRYRKGTPLVVVIRFDPRASNQPGSYWFEGIPLCNVAYPKTLAPCSNCIVVNMVCLVDVRSHSPGMTRSFGVSKALKAMFCRWKHSIQSLSSLVHGD